MWKVWLPETLVHMLLTDDEYAHCSVARVGEDIVITTGCFAHGGRTFIMGRDKVIELRDALTKGLGDADDEELPAH